MTYIRKFRSRQLPTRLVRQGGLLLLVLMLISALPAVNTVYAQDGNTPNNFVDERQNTQEVRTKISRRQAMELAQKSYSGRVLSVRLDGSQWRVRMDQDGKVFNVFVHAQSGKVTRPE